MLLNFSTVNDKHLIAFLIWLKVESASQRKKVKGTERGSFFFFSFTYIIMAHLWSAQSLQSKEIRAFKPIWIYKFLKTPEKRLINNSNL